MSHVVGAECITCMHTTCVDVCPVDAFRKSSEFLVIDPTVCIDCGVCVPECPVDAIFQDNETRAGKMYFIEANRAAALLLPEITRSKFINP